LHAFEGGEAPIAIDTKTAAADRDIILGRTAVLDLGVFGSAKRTAHEKPVYKNVNYSLTTIDGRNEAINRQNLVFAKAYLFLDDNSDSKALEVRDFARLALMWATTGK
jgi:hypothetical protein